MQAARAAGLDRKQYGKALSDLQEQACLEVIQRGNSFQDTIVSLLHPPDAERFLLPGLTMAAEVARLRAEVDTIKRQLGGLDIVKALKYLEDKIEQQTNPKN